MILLLRKSGAEDDIDMTSMSFRQKLEQELQKPLSNRIRPHRRPFNVSENAERDTTVEFNS